MNSKVESLIFGSCIRFTHGNKRVCCQCTAAGRYQNETKERQLEKRKELRGTPEVHGCGEEVKFSVTN
jgi:hypothetical protein